MPLATAAGTPTVEQLNKDIRFVDRLVNESAAAKQIAASSNQDAKSQQRHANELLQQARQAVKAGDAAGAVKALGQAKLTMFTAMRDVGGKVKAEKQNDDFQRRLQSTESLLQAQKNYIQENKEQGKHLNGEAVKTAKFVEDAIDKARQEFARGEHENAQEVLENAYLTIKLSLTTLRTGQTIVRTLSFANKEEEYRYELDRNDTHKMLVNVVLNEKLAANPALAKLVDINMKAAQDLRNKAVTQAEHGDFKSAVETLEQSTRQIVRAIRAAGIYIPG
jgi:tetratricopeptide (TPR) repeat protein